VTGTGTTDEKGKIVVEVVYPKNTAWWSEQRIESTINVNGTEYKEYTDFTLPVMAADIKGENTPPNVESPYGTWGDCTANPDLPAPAEPATPVIPVISVINSLTETPVGLMENSGNTPTWYAITVDGKRAVKGTDYTISTSNKVDIEYGPNNDFKLVDKDKNVDDSGFFITVTTKVTQDRPNPATKPIFYKDYPVGGEGPIITLNGLGSITLNQGDTYNELGANAVDQTDDVLAVQTYGKVDTSKPGVYTIIYRTVDKNGLTAFTTRKVTVLDPDVPVITLNGAANMTIALNSTYIEPGATALDASDGVLNVSITGDTVDTSIADTYTVIYSATDSSGHTSTATRTVTVQ